MSWLLEQVEDRDKDRSNFQAIFSRWYGHFGLGAPKVYRLANPFELQTLLNQRGRGLEQQRHHSASLFYDLKAPSINSRVWQWVQENLARPLTKYCADQKGLLQYIQEQQKPYREIEAALNHFIKQHSDLRLKAYAHHPSFKDAQWLFYHSEVEMSSLPLGGDLKELLEGRLMYSFFTEKAVFWCPLPHQLNYAEGVLHGEDQPSISWEDQHLYHWKGVPVPAKLIETPDLVNREDFLREHNAEVRRCFQEKLGTERFAELFDLELIDENIDRQGNRQILYRTKELDQAAREKIQFARVCCPTTGRIYFLCVPPEIENVSEAVAWTFGRSAEDYQPIIET